MLQLCHQILLLKQVTNQNECKLLTINLITNSLKVIHEMKLEMIGMDFQVEVQIV